MKLSQLLTKTAPAPARGKMVQIRAGKYTAGGVNTEKKLVEVGRDFFTPPSEVTNATVDTVRRAYPGVSHGVFMEDTQAGPTQGYIYLLAAGSAEGDMTTIDEVGGGTHLFPPSLGIEKGQSFDDFVAQHPGVIGGRFKIHAEDVRPIMPAVNRYEKLRGWDYTADEIAQFTAPDVAATMVDAYAAQAVAQLIGGQGLLETLFDLAGAHYVDVPNHAQWGLLALEGQQEYMTSTGALTDDAGRKLRAHRRDGDGRSLIEPPTRYAALPNGVLPNTVWNWVKELGGLRGGSWLRHDPDGLRLAFRNYSRPADRNVNIGFRLVASPQDSVA